MNHWAGACDEAWDLYKHIEMSFDNIIMIITPNPHPIHHPIRFPGGPRALYLIEFYLL